MSQPGIRARTRVTLAPAAAEAPIRTAIFEHRVSASERREGVSILFGPATSAYWSNFYIPVARWNTAAAAREPRAFRKPPVAVDVLANRAIVLFGDGDFRVFDLSDPASPTLLGEYRRPRDLARFDGVRGAGDRVVVFGPDGMEVVRFTPDGPRREAVLGREDVGSLSALEPVADGFVAAGNRGLLWIGEEEVRTLLDRPVRGLASRGDRLLFTDEVALYVATLPLLRAGRVEGEVRLGRDIAPRRLRARGNSAVVLGERGTAWVDVSQPARPRLVSRIGALEVGDVVDATVLGGRLFLLGARGLQISDAAGERVVDAVDVRARQRLGATGRHLVMVGEGSLQVVDTTPFVAASAAASSR